MKKLISILPVAIALLLLSQSAFAHDPEKHKKPEQQEATIDSAAQQAATGMDTTLHEGHEVTTAIESLDEFPNYHPLIVHFPIVLLLLAAAMQLFGFFIKNEGYHRTILALAALGYATAYFAAAWRHPHVDPELVNDAIKSVFDEHQLYAKWAVYLGGAGAVAKAVELYFKRKIVLVILTTLLLAGAAAAVSISGHHGAELVHKHGVGTQGRYLETHEDGGQEHEH